ncbi:MAG: efflux RND transporter periplasmic adaptor subunit [Deltaproteobacteria bacterium]|nr:efflux RND transporter periplasmic adaptor subunit [Deltaproteobacteria bacterium]
MTEAHENNEPIDGGTLSAQSLVKRYIFIVIPLLIVAAAAAVIVIGLLRPQPAMQMRPQPVTLVEIKKTLAKSYLRVTGLVEADLAVELKARVSGFLLEKSFQAGDTVTEGQVLFQIEPDSYQAALNAAEADVSSADAQLGRAELEYNRIRDLYDKKSAPKSDFDNAAAALDVAKAALQSAQARLEQAALTLQYTTVKAPFTGQISDSTFSVGSLLGPESGVLARIVKVDEVEVSFGVSDKVMAGSRLGNPRSGLPGSTVENLLPRLIINGRDFYELDGHISYISPEVGRQSDTVSFKARFDNPKGILIPGQSVVVNLEPKTPSEVLLLPKNTVMTSQGSSYVYVTAPNPNGGLVSETRPVTLGFEYEEGFEILSGLAEGDQVISLGLMSGGARLRPGYPVTVVEDPKKPQAQAAGSEISPNGDSAEEAPGSSESQNSENGSEVK